MSMKQNFEIGKAPILNFIECMGNLNIKGSDQSTVTLKGDGLDVSEKETGLNITAHSDIKASVPAASEVDLRQVHGDLMVKGLVSDLVVGHVNGNLSLSGGNSLKAEAVLGDARVADLDGVAVIETVSGDLSVRKVAALSADTVQGDCSAKSVDGDLKFDMVSGDLNVRKCSGGVTVREVMGDAHIRKIDGILNLESIMGDMHLGGPLTAGKHHVNAQGDVIIRWPVDQPVQFLIDHDGELINHLPTTAVEAEDDGEGAKHFSAQIGDGSAVLIIEAGGDVVLKPYGENFEFEHAFENGFTFNADLDLGLEDLGERISSKIEALAGHLNRKFGPEMTSKLESKIEKAVEKATSKLEKAQYKMHRSPRTGFHPRPPKSPKAPQAPEAPKPNESEQLKILQMLENGSITVEDATTLLKALE